MALICLYFLGVFIVFGLSGIAPATHYGIVNGWEKSMSEAAMGWLVLMGKTIVEAHLYCNYACLPSITKNGNLNIFSAAI